jgi:hypothetical protein
VTSSEEHPIVFRSPRPGELAELTVRSRGWDASLEFGLKGESIGEIIRVMQWGEVHTLADFLITWLQRMEPRRLERLQGPHDQLPPLSPGE